MVTLRKSENYGCIYTLSTSETVSWDLSNQISIHVECLLTFLRPSCHPISPRHTKWSVNGVLDDDDRLNRIPYLVLSSDWLKLKVILVYDYTLSSSKLRLADHNKQSEGFKALALRGLPSPSLHRYSDPGLFSHVDTLDKGGDCLWCFLVSWLCLVPPYAKCRVCEDMQVARCLCNFPPAPSEKKTSST